MSRKIGHPCRAKVELEGGAVTCDFLMFIPPKKPDDVAVYGIEDHVYGTEIYNAVRDELQIEIFKQYRSQNETELPTDQQRGQ